MNTNLDNINPYDQYNSYHPNYVYPNYVYPNYVYPNYIYPNYIYPDNQYYANNKNNNKNKNSKSNYNKNSKNNYNKNTKNKENLDKQLFNSIQNIINEMDNSAEKPIIKNITIKKINSSKNSDINETIPYNLFSGQSVFPISFLNELALDEKQDKKELSIDEFVLDLSKDYDELDLSLNSLDSLIELGKRYDPETAHKYAINLKRLNLLIPTLEKLKNVVGMQNVKDSIVNQIVYFMSAFEPNDNMLHTVISGPPGVGKTMLGQIIGEIYFKLGIIKGSKEGIYPFKIARRSDLIGQYLGQTALKTQKIIDECEGGVLFIDEAYSLGSGSSEKSDIYSKECIDTINLNLTEKKKNFVCIIAGYSECLEKDFFSVNPGLKRRFPFTYSIEKYNANELGEIFNLMMTENKWTFEKDIVFNNFKNFLSKNYESFPNFGGDMETLFFNIKIAHALRVVGKKPCFRKKITNDDIESGFKIYKLSKVKKQNIIPDYLQGLYA
jgi:SpoVK/Ycf46/Vps4 family AAA+-type ATPase